MILCGPSSAPIPRPVVLNSPHVFFFHFCTRTSRSATATHEPNERLDLPPATILRSVKAFVWKPLIVDCSLNLGKSTSVIHASPVRFLISPQPASLFMGLFLEGPFPPTDFLFSSAYPNKRGSYALPCITMPFPPPPPPIRWHLPI